MCILVGVWFVLLTAGCSSRQGSSEPCKASAGSTQSALGPYIGLLSSSKETVLQNLGKPAQIKDHDAKTKVWVYPDQGLDIAIWNDASVFWIIQTKGCVVEGLQIGDTEQKAEAVLGGSVFARKSDGVRMIRTDTDQFGLEVGFKDGRVDYAYVTGPQ